MRLDSKPDTTGAKHLNLDILNAGTGTQVNFNLSRGPGVVNVAASLALLGGLSASNDGVQGNLSVAATLSFHNNLICIGAGYDLYRSYGPNASVGLFSSFDSNGTAITNRAFFVLLSASVNVGQSGGTGAGAINGTNTLTI